MQTYNLAIAYKWIYDKELVERIEKFFQSQKLTTFVIHKDIIHSVLHKVQNEEIYFDYFLDRATDEDEDFEPLARAIIDSGTTIINHHDLIDEAIDKAEMHLKLKNAGVTVPPTIILPPYEEVPTVTITDTQLSQLGIPFVVKPAYYTGGGEGVITNANSIDDINLIRKEFCDDRVLLQKKIETKIVNNFKYWFRSFFFFGNVYTVQWDYTTKLYDDVLFRNLPEVDYDRIVELTKIIAELSGLDYFSTEITISPNGEYFPIDYVNDPCDLRKKSLHPDGVPDTIVDKFIEALYSFVKTGRQNQ